MVTPYDQLHALCGDGDLDIQVRIASIIAADKILCEPPDTPEHVARMFWAKTFLQTSQKRTFEMKLAVIAICRELSQPYTDAQVQRAIDAAIPLFADGT